MNVSEDLKKILTRLEFKENSNFNRFGKSVPVAESDSGKLSSSWSGT